MDPKIIAEALESEAIRSKGKTKSGLAKALKVWPSAVTAILDGKRQIKAKEAEIIREYLELDQGRAVSAAGVPVIPHPFDERDTIPVFAAAEAGPGYIIVSTDEIDRIPRPYVLENVAGAYGILVVGESMFPAFKPGDTAWIDPRLPPMRDAEAILYKGEEGETTATIKQLVNWTDQDWSLQQWNPAKKFKLDRGLWKTCHRVVGKFSRR